MKHKHKLLSMVAISAVLFSGLSVWASVSEIDDQSVLSDMYKQGLYTHDRLSPQELEESDPRSDIPQSLLEQLNPPGTAEVKGEA
jgi:hypothetical protein